MYPRVIALDGSMYAGKTFLSKKIILGLKDKGYNPIISETTNSFFNLYNLYLNDMPAFKCGKIHTNSCIGIKNHYTGPNMYNDCFFVMPINQYLKILFQNKSICDSNFNDDLFRNVYFILNNLFSLYYQSLIDIETHLTVDDKNIAIMDGTLFEILAWFNVFTKNNKDYCDYAKKMVNKIKIQFPNIFENCVHYLVNTSPLIIYDRICFDEEILNEYICIYNQINKNVNSNIDNGMKAEIAISFLNDTFQDIRNTIRQFNICSTTISGNTTSDLNENLTNILQLFD